MLDSHYQAHVSPHLRAAMSRLRDPQTVWEIFCDDETIAQMERLGALKRPAVGAASARLLALGEWVRDRDAKLTFGKIARCIMEKRGYVVDLKGVETPEDPLFTKGTRYRLRAPPAGKTAGMTLIIRDLAPDVATLLIARAARDGRSVEAEAAHLIGEALRAEVSKSEPNLAEAIHRRFAALGGVDDLQAHPPVSTEPAPEFDP